MDFRIQNKSTGIPSSLNCNSNDNRPDQNSSPIYNSSPSHLEDVEDKRRRENNAVTNEVSSFTPSPATDHHHHHRPNQSPRRDLDRPDPTQMPVHQAPISTTTQYRECQKNHAAHLGDHVIDGCGEFMPNGEEGTPEALKCAACGCHRSFHRKEIEGGSIFFSISNNYKQSSTSISPTTKRLNVITTTGTTNASAQPAQFHPSPLQQSAMSINHHRIISHHHLPTMMAFGDHHGGVVGAGGGGGAESSSEDLNLYRREAYSGIRSSSNKRFRTKFTQEQKDKMMEFAQKIGWRIQKQNEVEVQQFCAGVGVKKKVFKVWMHNNKQATKRKDS